MKIQVGDTILFTNNINESVEVIEQILNHIDPKMIIIDNEELPNDILKMLMKNNLLEFFLRIKNNVRILDASLIIYRGFNLYGKSITDILTSIKNENKKDKDRVFDKLGMMYEQIRYSGSVIFNITDADELIKKDFIKVSVNGNIIFIDNKYKNELYKIVKRAEDMRKGKSYSSISVREGVFDKYLLVYNNNDSTLPALLVKKYDFFFDDEFYKKIIKLYSIMDNILSPIEFSDLIINDSIKYEDYILLKGSTPLTNILLNYEIYNKYFLRNTEGKINVTPQNIDDFESCLHMLRIELKV